MTKSIGGVRGSVWRRLSITLFATFVLVPAGPTVAAPSSDNPAAALPIQACPAGDVLLLPLSSSVENDGWIKLNYDTDGIRGYSELPPAGFDAVQASDEMLTRHHLPERPQIDANTAQWTAEASRLWWVRTQGLCRDPNSSNSGSHQPSVVWGGDEVRVQPVQPPYEFAAVRANMTQVAATNCPSSGAQLSSWVGLGGHSPVNAPLIQAGTTTYAPEYGQLATYGSWWEFIIPATGYDSTPVDLKATVRGGDNVFEEVSVTNGSAWLEVWDVTTGSIGTFVENLDGWDPGGSSAEWIDERRKSPLGGYFPLPNYGKTHWSGMQVIRSNSVNWTGAYSEPTEWWVDMWSGGTKLSYTSGTDSGNHMQNTWLACQ